ncbi:hypothetical protein F4778DRAFT_687333 [Xylariomycetidae sp. FL2044]|nr:hypothetical protein F4778DRAFT_687333 [Xylariomycetidae sp. FL2044]
MSSQNQSPYGTSNPFRRKSDNVPPPAPDPVGQVPILRTDGPFTSAPKPPFTTFKSAAPEEKRRDEEERPIQPKPKKIVKKVRVQSPPPSSPEDSVPVTRFPPRDYHSDDDSDSSESRYQNDPIDPFNAMPSGSEDAIPPEPPLPRLPHNPFSKTLQDLEQPLQGQETSTNTFGGNKGALDVDSFQRLLLTGYANIPGPSSEPSRNSPQGQPPLHDGASNTDASSISRQSIFDAIQETPRTSHEISEAEEAEERRRTLPTSPLSTVHSASTRTKPAPPSSRHGKLIKIELGSDPTEPRRTPTQPTPTDTSLSVGGPLPNSTDVNKPLPPIRPSADEEATSPFDREAAGKVPEAFAELQANPRPPTPPPISRNRSESYGSNQSSRKPAAPPPRRHGRSDSRTPSINTTNPEEEPHRSSIESDRSRADSLRVNISSSSNLQAPAPPPPRRPNHARHGSSYSSPNQSNFGFIPALSPGASEGERSPLGVGSSPLSVGGPAENVAGLATVTTTRDGLPKLSPPPPPPARQVSTRRPASVRSMEAGSGIAPRRVSKEKEAGISGTPPPPPPPPRQRGGSRTGGNPSVSSGARATATSVPGGQTKQEVSSTTSTTVGGQAVTGSDGKHGAEILADIETLQRDLNAAMGKG